jgi:polysaccharide biosynthesis/export protein
MRNTYKIITLPLLFVLMVILSNSCKVLNPTEMLIEGQEYPISGFEPSKKEYVIQLYDEIQIRVNANMGESFFGGGGGGGASYQRNQQGFAFPVEFDGQIKLPIIGRIPINGLTVREAEQKLEEIYSQYYVNPFIYITVTNRQIFVFKNNARSASVVRLNSDRYSLIEAIANSGGLSGDSKSYKIKLIRGDLTNNPKVYYWNVRTLEDLKGTNLLLEANDIIYIDSRPQYINRVLREISPYLTAVTTGISIYALFFNLL